MFLSKIYLKSFTIHLSLQYKNIPSHKMTEDDIFPTFLFVRKFIKDTDYLYNLFECSKHFSEW